MPRKKKAVSVGDSNTPVELPVDEVGDDIGILTRSKSIVGNGSQGLETGENSSNIVHIEGDGAPTDNVQESLTADRVHDLLQANSRDVQERLQGFEAALLQKITDLLPKPTSENHATTNSSIANNNSLNTNHNASFSALENTASMQGPGPSSTGVAGAGVVAGVGTSLLANAGNTDGRGGRYAPASAALHEGDKGLSIDTDLIASSLHQLLGKPAFANSTLLVAGSFLSLKVKNAIRAGEYVELCLMDTKVDTTTKLGMSVSPTSFSLTPTRAKKASNETEWTNWFCTYSSVYVASYPDAAPEMFSYLMKMLHFFSKYSFLEGRKYDEHFRWAKSQVPSMRWNKTEFDILELVTDGREGAPATAVAKRNTLGRTRPSFNANGNSNGSYQQKSNDGLFCYDFNNLGSYCRRKKCPYQHVCSGCKSNHPRFKCQTHPQTTQHPTSNPPVASATQNKPKPAAQQRGKFNNNSAGH